MEVSMGGDECPALLKKVQGPGEAVLNGLPDPDGNLGGNQHGSQRSSACSSPASGHAVSTIKDVYGQGDARASLPSLQRKLLQELNDSLDSIEDDDVSELEEVLSQHAPSSRLGAVSPTLSSSPKLEGPKAPPSPMWGSLSVGAAAVPAVRMGHSLLQSQVSEFSSATEPEKGTEPGSEADIGEAEDMLEKGGVLESVRMHRISNASTRSHGSSSGGWRHSGDFSGTNITAGVTSMELLMSPPHGGDNQSLVRCRSWSSASDGLSKSPATKTPEKLPKGPGHSPRVSRPAKPAGHSQLRTADHFIVIQQMEKQLSEKDTKIQSLRRQLNTVKKEKEKEAREYMEDLEQQKWESGEQVARLMSNQEVIRGLRKKVADLERGREAASPPQTPTAGPSVPQHDDLVKENAMLRQRLQEIEGHPRRNSTPDRSTELPFIKVMREEVGKLSSALARCSAALGMEGESSAATAAAACGVARECVQALYARVDETEEAYFKELGRFEDQLAVSICDRATLQEQLEAKKGT